MAPSHTVQPSKRAAPCSTEQEGVSDPATAIVTHQHLNACSGRRTSFANRAGPNTGELNITVSIVDSNCPFRG